MAVYSHSRNRLVSGLLVLLPTGISLIVLTLLYRVTVGFVSRIFGPIFPELPGYLTAVASATVFVVILYGIGVLTTNVFGRRIIAWFERLREQTFLVSAIYGASK